MSRRRYQNVSPADRERLINAFEEDRDHLVFADMLGIPQRTARHIILTCKRTGRRETLARGGNRRPVLNDAMSEELIHYVEEKPTATLEEMRTRLLQIFPLRPVSTTTIWMETFGWVPYN